MTDIPQALQELLDQTPAPRRAIYVCASNAQRAELLLAMTERGWAGTRRQNTVITYSQDGDKRHLRFDVANQVKWLSRYDPAVRTVPDALVVDPGADKIPPKIRALIDEMLQAVADKNA